MKKELKSLDGIVSGKDFSEKNLVREKKDKKLFLWKIFNLNIFGFLLFFIILSAGGFLGFKYRQKIKIPANWLNWKLVLVRISVPINKEVSNSEILVAENISNQEQENVSTKTQKELDLEAQAEAKKWLEENAKNKEILANAKKEMEDDLVMVQYEYEQQLASLEWIDAQTAHPEIMKKAKKEWGSDYEMVRYMYEEEVGKIK